MKEIIDASHTLFIYKKFNEFKVLGLDEAISQSKQSLVEGWNHIATVEPKAYIISLLNKMFKEEEV